MSAKIHLTLDDIEPAVVVISEALPSHLKALFTDVIDTMTGGNQDIYRTVGIGISRRVAGYWGIDDCHSAVLAWHLQNYAPVPEDHPPYLRVAVTTPGETRQEAAQNLTAALHEWATATYKE